MLGTMEQRTEGMKRQANELIEQAYNRGYKAGYETGFKNGFDEGVLHPDINTIEKWIEQGRNEAWEVARKIYLSQLHGGMSGNDLISIFGYPTNDILARTTASEAIDKIREYEERKKQEEDEIKVGDEVCLLLDENYHSVVTCIYDKKAVSITQDGKWDVNEIHTLIKTGRHFQEIVEVLKKMQEGE